MVAAALTSRIRRVSKGGIRKAALFGAAGATAIAMTMGTVAEPAAPSANALTLDATTTGPLLWLINELGVDSIAIPDVPVLGNININLDWTKADPVALYNAINSPAFGPFNPINYSFTRPNLLATGGTGPVLVAIGTGVPAAIAAYQAMLASANGNTPAGYTPLDASGKVNISGSPCSSGLTCQQGYNVTNLPIALIRNPMTPNGGLYARFAPILNLFGQNPISPNAQSGSSTGIKLNTAIINIALGYDFLSDFPETLNPFSLANSVMAGFLPTYLLDGGTIKGAGTDTIVTNLGTLLSLGVTSTSYSTFVPNDLPLLEPLRLPSRILNEVFKQAKIPVTLGTPLADALQPALEILVNIGYTDVQTPSEGGTYNRTYDQSAQYVPFLSQATLTPQEWVAVPGDVVRALVNGFRVVLSGKSTSAPNTPDPHAPVLGTLPEVVPDPEPAAAVAASTPPASATTRSTATSGKPSKKPGSVTSKKSSAPKPSAKKGLGGSKRAAS